MQESLQEGMHTAISNTPLLWWWSELLLSAWCRPILELENLTTFSSLTEVLVWNRPLVRWNQSPLSNSCFRYSPYYEIQKDFKDISVPVALNYENWVQEFTSFQLQAQFDFCHRFGLFIVGTDQNSGEFSGVLPGAFPLYGVRLQLGGLQDQMPVSFWVFGSMPHRWKRWLPGIRGVAHGQRSSIWWARTWEKWWAVPLLWLLDVFRHFAEIVCPICEFYHWTFHLFLLRILDL